MNLKFHFLAIVVCGCFASQCTRSSEIKAPEPSDESLYIGSVACKSCHGEVYKTQQLTPHHLTSQLPDSISIKASFEEGKNVFFYSPEIYVRMEKEHSQYFQTLYARNEKVKSKSIDLVFGSGVRGQTYLSWKDSSLYQLPIGYFTSVNAWVNSPGFSNRPIFNRPITSRCLECHSTFIKKSLPGKSPEHFSKKSLILGIECEKCHGSGRKHVEFHQDNVQIKEGKFIISFKNLSRKRQLDFCRSCHGGKLVAKKQAFSFKAGEDLNEYFAVDSTKAPSASLDSHGNQYGMLRKSKCFLRSDMTCVTCHQVHKNERGKAVEFSNRCMTCHMEKTNSFCKFNKLRASQLKQNCVQCHMPEKNSNSVRMLLQSGDIPVPAKMHVHRISVYQDEIIRYINSIPLSKN